MGYLIRRSGSGALRPPPPVAAALVPRCALLPAATPRLTDARDAPTQRSMARNSEWKQASPLIKRGVGAGRSAQRGTSGATTGPRRAAGPHNPEELLAVTFEDVFDDLGRVLFRTGVPRLDVLLEARLTGGAVEDAEVDRVSGLCAGPRLHDIG